MAREKANIFPSVVVYKLNRKNAKVKMKIFKTKSLDEINNMDIPLDGIPNDSIILDIGCGKNMVEILRKRHFEDFS